MNFNEPTTRRNACYLVAAAGLSAVGYSVMPAMAQKKPKLDVVYVPTPQLVVDRMLELAGVKADNYVIDLGCGDGRMIVTAATRYGARGYGVDIDPERIQEANASAKKAGVTDKVSFKVADLFGQSLAKADVMTMYLLTEINLKLRPKILSELKPGARVVSHAFAMGDWEADTHEVVDSKDVYLWYVPAKVQGAWAFEGEESMQLRLTQQYQNVTGDGTVDGRAVKVSGKLKGTEITLNVEVDGKRSELRGQVEGKTIKGTGGNWTARQA